MEDFEGEGFDRALGPADINVVIFNKPLIKPYLKMIA